MTATLILSACATARARGTWRTGSPAGSTWTLSETGAEEAMRAGRLLAEEGYQVDVVAHTSVLKRAIPHVCGSRSTRWIRSVGA